MNQKNVELANELRLVIQKRTDEIDDGEAVAAILLWSFLEDHARAHGMNVGELAEHQWAAFTQYALEHLSLAKSVN